MYRQIFFLFVCHSQIAQMRLAPCRYSSQRVFVVSASISLRGSPDKGLKWKRTSIDSCSSLFPPPNPFTVTESFSPLRPSSCATSSLTKDRSAPVSNRQLTTLLRSPSP
ncbi:hypothetical protein T4B_3785 [Trichinella pseudospiralis]|uniref:Uncharacterized protein n=1 Tax=Trichinella pseudospiralis TaxID=6337 RepID=A0A0V1F0A3_TRIPS|nr:hypothetical protein T4A_9793 [Trichinella pseudospiralis]KRZ30520.1 hypothetical protein T4B_3785 [Trichinella pseudospiralis]KRZ42724.1 hypothetical protein T4C_66 [Trichinella pseudospiralis]